MKITDTAKTLASKPFIRYSAVAITGLLIGSSAAGGDTVATSAAAEPTAVHTEYVEVEVPAEGKTKTVTVESTPQSCLDALDHARDGFGLAATFADITSDIMDIAVQALQEAAATGDVSQNSVDRMTAANSRIDTVNRGIDSTGPSFVSAASACEAG